MPAKILIPAIAGAIALSAATFATAKTIDTSPTVTGERQVIVIDADPAEFASDICWVAPEWRND